MKKRLQRQSKRVEKQSEPVQKISAYASVNTLNKDRHQEDLKKFKKELGEYVEKSIRNLNDIKTSVESYLEQLATMDAQGTVTNEMIAEASDQLEFLRGVSEMLQSQNGHKIWRKETSKEAITKEESAKPVSYAELLAQLDLGRKTLPPDLVSQGANLPIKTSQSGVTQSTIKTSQELRTQSETPPSESGIVYK